MRAFRHGAREAVRLRLQDRRHLVVARFPTANRPAPPLVERLAMRLQATALRCPLGGPPRGLFGGHASSFLSGLAGSPNQVRNLLEACDDGIAHGLVLDADLELDRDDQIVV